MINSSSQIRSCTTSSAVPSKDASKLSSPSKLAKERQTVPKSRKKQTKYMLLAESSQLQRCILYSLDQYKSMTQVYLHQDCHRKFQTKFPEYS